MIIFSIFVLDWCSSATDSLNSTSSVIIEDQSLVSLFLIFCLISIIGLLFHFRLTEKVRQSWNDDSNRHFTQGLFSLMMLAIFSFGNQSVSALTCRPTQMLYDHRYIFPFGLQFVGFLVSIHTAYAFGSVFVRLFDRRKINSAGSRSHTACCRSIKRLTSHRLRS